MVRFRVAPKPLPKVKPIHHEGVFGQFEDVTDKAIARLVGLEGRPAQEKIRFFQYLKQRVDAGRFGEMQETQLADGKMRPDSDIVKYIDPSTWFESKIDQALRLKLHRRAPIDILDIGTGPGHFPVVAEFYGHRVLGTDLPYRTTGKLERGHIYDSLAEIYQVDRIPMKVEAFTPLPKLPRKFDLVTSFLAAFNIDAERKPWSVEAWEFFIRDVRDNVLAEGGEIYLTLDDSKLTDASWEFLSSHAAFVNPRSKQVWLKDLDAFGALPEPEPESEPEPEDAGPQFVFQELPPRAEGDTAIRNRVEPIALPKVRDQHLEGIFGEFDDVVDRAIAEYSRSNADISAELVRFFNHLKQLVDREKFAKMQWFQLSEGKLDLESDLVKYIDPVTWFVSKLRLADQIELNKRPPMRILDIGTGPGHWPAVAQFYGHKVLGTELPLRATGKLDGGHLYDSLGDIYNVERIAMRVQPFAPLPKFAHRFDMMTAFLAAFNMDRNRDPWSIDAWNFFFTDLRRNVLTEDGEVYMSLTTFKTPPAVWDYLKSLAVFTHDDSMVIHIKDLSRFS